jgi:membrane associated rhomboid family serine protease
MPYFVYGSDAAGGETPARIFSTAANRAEARREAEAKGMRVSAVVACRDEHAPAPLPVAPSRKPARGGTTALQAAQEAQFSSTLAQLTPRTYVTWIIVAANVIVFALMTLTGGASAVNPNVADLLHWGAEYGPQTLGGQPWRLFTALFVHIGFLHLICNMVAFGYAGPTVERLVGNAGFALLYLIAGLAGSLLALFWNPMIVHAGASAAVFGVYGALGAIALMQRDSIPPDVFRQIVRLVLVFVGYNVVYSLRPEVSLSAHAGGLVAGFVFGLVLALPLSSEAKNLRPRRNWFAAGGGLALLLAGLFGAHLRFANIDRLERAYDGYDAVLVKITPVLDAARKGEETLSDAAIADVIEHDLLPDWHRAREQLAAVTPVPYALSGDVARISDYMGRREKSWRDLVDALRSPDKKHLDEANQEVRDVNLLGEKIARTARLHLPSG